MANPERSKLMQASRNQFKTTKDGAVTYATNDIDLAYAHGFKNGRASSIDTKSLNIVTQLLKEQSLLYVAMTFNRDIVNEPVGLIKDDFLDGLNNAIGTKYGRTAIDNMLANPPRKNPPQSVLAYCRYVIAKSVLSDADLIDVFRCNF